MKTGLLDALNEIGWPDLPPAIDGNYKKKWIKAIVKTKRMNGDIGYCLAVNDGNDEPRIIRDFGPTAIILEIISVHPYEETDKSILPRLATADAVIRYLCKGDFRREEIEALLSKDNKSPEQIEADRRKIKGYIEQVAMKQARIKSASDEQAKQLHGMADPKLKEKKAKTRKYGRTTPVKTKGSKG